MTEKEREEYWENLEKERFKNQIKDINKRSKDVIESFTKKPDMNLTLLFEFLKDFLFVVNHIDGTYEDKYKIQKSTKLKFLSYIDQISVVLDSMQLYSQKHAALLGYVELIRRKVAKAKYEN